MKACFVAAELGGNDGRAPALPSSGLAVELLARRGWEVHLLCCGAGEGLASAAAAKAGAVVHQLAELPAPRGDSVPRFGGDDPALVLGERVLEALISVHERHRFDLIEFGDAGVAMRSVQAKRLGNALLDARIAVNLQQPAFWRRAQRLLDRAAPRDLKLDFGERYAFEHADFQLAASRDLLRSAREEEWAVRDDSLVAAPLPPPAPPPPVAPITRLALPGPLGGDGLALFLAALDHVDSELPVLFVGKDEPIGAASAGELIAARLGDRPHRFVEPGESLGALVGSGDTLVVHAGTADPGALAVAEAALDRVPFLAALSGAVPELLERAPGLEPSLFEPAPAVLAAAIQSRLALTVETEQQRREEAAAALDRESQNEGVANCYDELLQRPSKPRGIRVAEAARVSVVVAHYNHDRHLPGALASLAAQTRPPEEVIVVDDGSTSEAALRVFAEQEARYPQWAFVRQENAGPGVARNNGLALATGTYFLPFDSDNLATPELIGSLLAALESNPALSAVGCHNLAFAEDGDIAAGEFSFRYSPTGGPRILACVENVYGDTCSMFRTEALRRVGGFEVNHWTPTEDWETFAKMAMAGLELDVLPRPLFFYRTDSGGRLQNLGTDRDTTLRLRAYLVQKFFVNTTLDRAERRQLFECVQAFDHAVTEGMARRLIEQRRWHDSEMAALTAFRERQLGEHAEELRSARDRAEAAEAELASLREMTAAQVLLQAVRKVRRRPPGTEPD